MWFCWHRWKVSAVNAYLWVPKWAMPADGSEPKYGNRGTNVLYKCDKCGLSRVVDLDGSWSKEDLG